MDAGRRVIGVVAAERGQKAAAAHTNIEVKFASNSARPKQLPPLHSPTALAEEVLVRSIAGNDVAPPTLQRRLSHALNTCDAHARRGHVRVSVAILPCSWSPIHLPCSANTALESLSVTNDRARLAQASQSPTPHRWGILADLNMLQDRQGGSSRRRTSR